MAGKGLTAGNSFLTGVLAKLPPEDRAKGEEAIRTLQALGGGAVVEAVGDGTLAQSEFSRLSDELRTTQEDLDARATEVDERDQALAAWHTNLAGWKADHEELLVLGKQAKAGRVPVGAPRGTPPADTVTAEVLKDQLITLQANFLGFERDRNAITREHFTKFQEIVDVEPLLLHPQIKDLGLVGVYQLVHKDRLAKHTEDQSKAAEERIRADERTKVLATQAAMPYPSPTGVGSGSPLDALTAKTEPVVEAASAHYARLLQERAGASAL